MRRLIFFVSAALLVSALGGLVLLWGTDASNLLRPTVAHQKLASVSLMSIGACFILMQTTREQSLQGKVKSVLLGSAFFLWGIGQLLPPGPYATAADSLVIAVFVIDLALIVAGQFKSESKR